MPMKAFKCTVDLAIHRVTAPGVRLAQKEELYLNVCLLGQQRRTRLVPSQFPLVFDDHLIFEKTFRFCRDPSDVVALLNGLHTYVELIQLARAPGTEVLANFETTAKEFLYPFPNSKYAYHVAQRDLFMERTIEFPGTISPQIEFCTTTKIEETHTPTADLIKEYEERFEYDPIVDLKSHVMNKRQKKKRKSASAIRNTYRKHTISSAIKSDFGKPDVRHKLRELNTSLDSRVEFVPVTDSTDVHRKPPFIMKHCGEELIGRRPGSHEVLNDGLVFTRRSRSTSRTSQRAHSASHTRSKSRSASRNRSNSQNRSRALHRSLSPNPVNSVWGKIANTEAAVIDAAQSLNKNSNYDTSYGKCAICSDSHGDCEACENYRYIVGKNARGHKFHRDETKVTNPSAIFGSNSFSKKTAAELLKENRFVNSSDFLRRSYSPILTRPSFLQRYGDLDAYYALRDRIRDTVRTSKYDYPLNHSFSHYAPPPSYYSKYDRYYPWYYKYADYVTDLDDELFDLRMRARYPDLY